MGELNVFFWCYCGRPAIDGKNCSHHIGKTPDKKKARLPKQSGYSKSFVENRGSEEVMDED